MKFSFAHLLPGGRSRAQQQTQTGEDENTAAEGGDGQAENETPPEDGDGEGGGTGEDGNGDQPEGDDEENAEASARAAARARTEERARCAAIFASPAAAGNIAAACELAFNTSLSARQAIGVLTVTGGKAAGGGLRQAMAALSNPQIGSAGPDAGGDRASGPKANPLVAAHAKATGRRPRAR